MPAKRSQPGGSPPRRCGCRRGSAWCSRRCWRASPCRWSQLVGGDGRVGDLAVLYLRIGSLGLPSALIALAGQGYLRGVSDLRSPLVIVVVANAVNVVLNVVFIYGFGWGLAGSAWATVVAQTGMGAAFVRALLSAPADSRRPSLARMRPLARIGGEIFVRTAALYGSFLVASAVLEALRALLVLGASRGSPRRRAGRGGP